jgi:hypothetical protein
MTRQEKEEARKEIERAFAEMMGGKATMSNRKEK